MELDENLHARISVCLPGRKRKKLPIPTASAMDQVVQDEIERRASGRRREKLRAYGEAQPWELASTAKRRSELFTNTGKRSGPAR